jgi:hypothetical protein
MSRPSYDAANANIQVKINGRWQPANPQLREIYTGYKSLPYFNSRTSYSKYGITIFRTDNDPYMPTFYQWDGHDDTPVESGSGSGSGSGSANRVVTMDTNRNSYIFPENEQNENGSQEATPTPTPIIDFNDIYVFLVDGVTGPGSRNGAGWVKSRNYQAWAFIDFIYDTSVRKCYASRYSTYLAFPPGFDTRDVVTIDIEGLSPNIIFSISRNDNNSVYYERNDSGRSRVRICDNEFARAGFLGFYTRLTMDVSPIITPPPQAASHAYAHTTISSTGSALVCIGNKPPMIDLTDNEEEQCIMCYENKKNVRFMPCNHVVSCYRCVQQMNKCECPVCKSAIHTIQYVIS